MSSADQHQVVFKWFLDILSSSSPCSFPLLIGHIRNQPQSSSLVHSIRSVLNLLVCHPSSHVHNKWSSSIHLVKVPAGFEGVTQIPWGQKIKYKFIVDGEWIVHKDQPTELDPGGYVNNIYTAPAKPVILPSPETSSLPLGAQKPIAAEANNHTTNGDSVVAEVVDHPEYTPQPLPNHAQSLTGTDGKNVSVINLIFLIYFPI